MSYSVLIERRAQSELASQPRDAYDRLKAAILSLENNPRPNNCRKLTGRDAWRIRVGDYRVIYEVNDSTKTVVVLHVGHRRDIYR